MDLGAAGLKRQPFPTHGKPLAVVSYASEQAAIEMLRNTYDHPTGLSLLQGPSLSGKSTLIRTFIESLPDECSVAVVNGKGLNTSNLLISVLRQFGYEIDLSSANELLGLVRIFALQQASSSEPPLLVIKNVHELNPSALRAIGELAALKVRTVCALKMVLVSDRPLGPIVNSYGMGTVASRLLEDFHLRPMSRNESKHYLHTKLRAAGSASPQEILPDDICRDLWRASGGWPGILDRLALLAISSANTLPVTSSEIEYPVLPTPTWDGEARAKKQSREAVKQNPPHLVVTNNGSVMQDLTMDKPRLLVGRSEHNDISIGSRFISRHHVLLVRHGAATFLMDLNSTNGTFVNAARASNRVLRHEDVITIGHHKIKFYDPYATARGVMQGDEFADTTIMKTLEDMRNLLARENTAVMPAAPSEDLPTIRT